MSKCLTNAILVQLDPPSVQHGALRIEGESIVAVGRNVEPAAGDEVLDCHGCIVMPGLVNGHTHLYSALAAGMPAPTNLPTNFHEILKYIWWRLDRAHNKESVTASGTVGALAALRCGTTTLFDHHASPSFIEGSLTALEQGIARVGCRAVTCYEVTDRNFEDEASRGIAENIRYIEACRAAKSSQFAGMIGAHASFTLSQQSLAQCADACRQIEAGLHIHVAEDQVDATITQENFGCGLLERLDRHGILELPDTIIAHGTHFTDAEWSRLNERADALSIAHNPNSNMNNGVGYTPIAKLANPPMLGTDGIGADLWRETRTALFKSNDASLSIPCDWPLRMLGASARLASTYLGVPLGVLAPGAAADIVVTNYRPATPLDANNLPGHFVYAMGPEYVLDVMIAGDWCLRNGTVVSCDEPAEREQAIGITQALYTRLPSI